MSLIFQNKIKKLKKFLTNELNNTNKKSDMRNRKINFTDVFYFINLYNSDINSSYDKIYYRLLIENTYNDISKNAFIKKRNDLSIEHFETINDHLIKFIYNDLSSPNKERYLAVDCSNLCFLYSLNEHFKPNKHNTYTNGCLSCLYDVDLQIPINYNLSNSFDERSLLIEQFKYIKPNDVIIADRGYYSDDLVKKFIDNNFNFIFRLRSNELKTKIFSENNLKNKNDSESYLYDYQYNNKIIKFKVVKYQTYIDESIKNEDIDSLNKEFDKINQFISNTKTNISNLLKEYNTLKIQNKKMNDIIKNNLILTKKIYIKSIKYNNLRKKNINNEIDYFKNLLDNLYKIRNKIKNKKNLIETVNDSTYYIITNKIDLSNEKIKEIYKKRWDVEINFRFLKDKFKMKTMESKSLNIIKQNILVSQFIFLLENYIELILKKEKKENKKFNKSTFIDMLNKYLLKYFIINKNNKKTLNAINNILIIIIKSIITYKITEKAKPRIKKRPGSKWISINTT